MRKEGGGKEVSSKRRAGGSPEDRARREEGEGQPSIVESERSEGGETRLEDVPLSRTEERVSVLSPPGATPPATQAVSPSSGSEPALSSSTQTGRSQVEAGGEESPPRQVIAVSATKGPAAFFNLARKFLVTDEMCDLSALEGAIVSAIDAAHLLERSKLATIVRIQTSYVTVEPKRKKQTPATSPTIGPGREIHQRQIPRIGEPSTSLPASSMGYEDRKPAALPQTITGEASLPFLAIGRGIPPPAHGVLPPALPPPAIPHERPAPRSKKAQRGKGKERSKELRRARIIITVKRTEAYERWLEENPLQEITGDDEDEPNHAAAHIGPSSPPPS